MPGVIKILSHYRYGDGVLISEPTREDAEWAVMEFQAEHPTTRFGPVHPACGGTVFVATGFRPGDRTLPGEELV